MAANTSKQANPPPPPPAPAGLKIGTRVMLAYGLLVAVALSSAIASLNWGLAVEREISRTTDLSASIELLTDNIEQRIYSSQLALNGYIVERALAGVPDDTRPQDAQTALAGIYADIDNLRDLTATSDDPLLAQLEDELETLELGAERLEVRVAGIVGELEALGDEQSGRQGDLLTTLQRLGEESEATGQQEIHVAALSTLDEARGFLVDGQPARISSFQDSMALFEARVQASESLSPVEKTRLSALATDSVATLDDVITLQLSFDTRYNAFQREAVALQNNVDRIRQIGRADFEASVAAVDAAQRVARSGRNVTLILLVILLPVSAMLALGIANSITRPLAALVDVTRQLAGGNLQTRAEMRSGDEVGLLAGAFNRMAAELETSITRTRQASILAEALADTAAALTSTLDFEDALDRIIENIGRIVEHDAVTIDLVDLAAGTLRHVRGSGYGSTMGYEMAQNIRTISELPLLESLLGEHVPVVVPDTRAQSKWRLYPHSSWVKSHIGVPIILHGEVIGLLNVDSRTPGFYADFDTIPLQTFAAQAAIAINNARIYREIANHRNHLSSAVKERTLELSEANAHLTALSRLKDEFVANVSHELRTPITNLKLHHELLNARPDRADTYLATMKRETGRLERIVEDLLQLSRMDQEQSPLNIETVDLNKLVGEYTDDRPRLAQSMGLTLNLAFEPDLPHVLGDRGLLGLTLSVLLTNAFNYTPSGGRVLVGTHSGSASEDGWAGFSVSDSGPGIPADEQPHVFERFFRGTAAQRSQIPGTGLGLAIAYEIVERHGGRIEVADASKPYTGARFNVWLPPAQ